MEHIISTLRDVNLISSALRIILATLMGAVIGKERKIRGRSAGTRTYAIVCVGSCLAILIDMYLFQRMGMANTPRIGAQVISGIGFLGAGTILVRSDNKIQGLTTAASLWASACLGLALGTGFYEGAIFGFVAIIIVTWIFPRGEHD